MMDKFLAVLFTFSVACGGFVIYTQTNSIIAAVYIVTNIYVSWIFYYFTNKRLNAQYELTITTSKRVIEILDYINVKNKNDIQDTK